MKPAFASRAWSLERLGSCALRAATPPVPQPMGRWVKTTRMGWLAAMLLVAAIWPAVVEAQAPAKVPRIGILSPGTNPEPPPPWSIRPHLAAIGYAEGANVVYELRGAAGRPGRLTELAADLVRLRVDVIVAFTNPAAFAAKNATSTIPIVVWGAHGAIDTGLVNSLARPGGNVTGVESLAPELDAKRLQILKEMAPGLVRVGVLYNPDDQGSPIHLKSVQAAARILKKVEVVPIEVRRAEDFDRAFPATKAFDALLTFTDGWLTSSPSWQRVADYALAHRIPTMCEFKFYVQAYGCLIAYGPTLDEFSVRAAQQIDRILKGAKPGDLPFEQVTRFPMVVNKKTAAAIGVSIPPSVVLAVDEWFE